MCMSSHSPVHGAGVGSGCLIGVWVPPYLVLVGSIQHEFYDVVNAQVCQEKNI